MRREPHPEEYTDHVDLDETGPRAFVQWKGTNVCMDFTCDCDATVHIHGLFVYSVRCPYCRVLWEMPSTVTPRRHADQNDTMIPQPEDLTLEDWDPPEPEEAPDE